MIDFCKSRGLSLTCDLSLKKRLDSQHYKFWWFFVRHSAPCRSTVLKIETQVGHIEMRVCMFFSSKFDQGFDRTRPISMARKLGVFWEKRSRSAP